VIRKLKWPLNIAICLYLLLIPAIIITGGFEIDPLGVNMNHISNPIHTVVILFIFRLLFFIEFKDFLLFSFSLCVSLIAIELLLRILSPDIAVSVGYKNIHRQSPIYGYELVPNTSIQHPLLKKNIVINSEGMRDLPVEETASSIKKIAIIGDSFTCGMGVELEDTYFKQLEKQLNGFGIRNRTYNLGVIGYDMWQLVEVAKSKALKLNPDLVILGFFHNDMVRTEHPRKEDPDWIGYNPFISDKRESPFYLSNFLFNVNKIIETKYRKGRGEEYWESMEARKIAFGPSNPDGMNYKILYGKLNEKYYRQFSNKMEELSSILLERGIPVLGVFIPDAAQINNPPAQHVNNVFKTECLKNNIHFIDLTDDFESEDNP
jgi:lysophospholipase L1-like esterase